MGGDQLLGLLRCEPPQLRPAPLHGGKALALEGGQVLLRDLHRPLQGPPGHEHPQQAVRLRGDGQLGVVRVGVKLEGHEVELVGLHFGQPVDDELIGLPAGETQFFKGALQKGGGVRPGDAEAPGEVIVPVGEALPVEVIVGLARLVRQGAVRGGGDGPALLAVGGIGAGQFPIVVQSDVDLGLFLRVEVEDGLGIEVSMIALPILPAAGEQGAQQCRQTQRDKDASSHKLPPFQSPDTGIDGKRGGMVSGRLKISPPGRRCCRARRSR